MVFCYFAVCFHMWEFPFCCFGLKSLDRADSWYLCQEEIVEAEVRAGDAIQVVDGVAVVLSKF